jgi:hypothetical protein
MYKTLIQTLLAGFYAILVASPLEGGGVMIAARQIAFGNSLVNKEEEMYKELFFNLVGRTMSGELIDENIEYVGRYGLGFNISITRIELPNCTACDVNAFSDNRGMKYISLPKLLNGSNSMLAYSSALEEAHLDSVMSLGVQTFLDSSVKKIYIPNIQKLYAAWCNGNDKLTDIYATNRTTAEVLAISGFPAFVNMDNYRANITWHCKDGTITWDGSAWVANPF